MTNKKKRFMMLLITTLIITSILSIGCGTVTNYVYEPTAGSMKWVTIDGEDFNPNTDNVAPMFSGSNPEILAQTVSLNGYPYLFIDNGYRKKCIRWNGTKWVNLDGSPWYSATKQCPDIIRRSYENLSMKLDSNNNPHLVWLEDVTDELFSDSEIFYARWDNDEWITANGEEFNYESGNGNVSNSGDSFRAISQSFAVDSKGNPYIIWLNIYDKTSKSRRVSYITWNRKSWVNGYGEEYIPELEDSLSTRTFSNAEISGDFYARNPMILIDSEDNPCIIWNYYESESEHCRTNYSEGVYIKKADDGWVTINDENWNPELGNGRLNYKICDFTSLNHFDLDAHNKPYLTWINYSKSDAMFIALIKGEKNIWKTINGDKWDKTGSNCLLDVLRMQTNMKPPEIGVSSIIKIDTFNSIHLLWHYDIHKHIDGKYTRITHMFYSKWDGENWRTIDGQICNASSKNYGLVFATSSEHETLLERDLFIDKDNIPHIFWIFSGGSLNYIKGVQVK